MIRHIISIIFLTIFPLTLVTHLNYCSTSMCFEPNSIMFIGFGGTWFAAKAKRIIVFTTQFFLTNGKRLVWLSFWFFGEFYFYPSESLRVKLWKLVLGNYWTFWHLAWMDFLRNANKIERFPMMNFAKGDVKASQNMKASYYWFQMALALKRYIIDPFALRSCSFHLSKAIWL